MSRKREDLSGHRSPRSPCSFLFIVVEKHCIYLWSFHHWSPFLTCLPQMHPNMIFFNNLHTLVWGIWCNKKSQVLTFFSTLHQTVHLRVKMRKELLQQSTMGSYDFAWGKDCKSWKLLCETLLLTFFFCEQL
jgi:hypothetical protein